MCDFRAGEIILSVPDEPLAVWTVEGVLSTDSDDLEPTSLDSRLDALHVPAAYRVTGRYRYWLVRTEAGQEAFVADRLRRRYQDALLADPHLDALRGEAELDPGPGPAWTAERLLLEFAAGPNSLLEVASPNPVVIINEQQHRRNADLLHMPGGAPPGPPVRIAVLDTGADPDLLGPDDLRADYVAGARYHDTSGALIKPEFGVTGDVPDRTGHGSAVVAIIKKLVPNALLTVCKVIDDSMRASEFDVLAALKSLAGADVVNLSLGLVHHRRDWRCGTCGRHSGAARSIVLEQVVEDVLNSWSSPVIVAAAGNSSAERLTYPARYAGVMAVGAVTAGAWMSSFSNHGAVTEQGGMHENLFFAPGGESAQAGPSEEIASASGISTDFWGTSFSAAYASAVVAHELRRHGDREVALSMLRAQARPLTGHDPTLHGNGLLTCA